MTYKQQIHAVLGFIYNELLNWEGVMGYTNTIMEYIELAFGIDLNNVDGPKRIREDE